VPQGRCARSAHNSKQALRAQLPPHQSGVLTELLAQRDGLDETIARLSTQIQATGAQDAAEAEVVALLDTIPGLSQTTAQVVVGEIGADMTHFPSAAALAAWGGLAPGARRERTTRARDGSARRERTTRAHDESAGRQRSGRTRTGNTWLRTQLVQAAQAAAQAAAHTKHTALAAR
jgi:transposase